VTSDLERAATLFEESLTLHRELGDQHDVISALNRLGWLAHNQGNFARAEALFVEILALTRERGNKHAIPWSLNTVGELARSRGDGATARAYYDKSLALRRELQAIAGVAMVLHNLGYVSWLMWCLCAPDRCALTPATSAAPLSQVGRAGGGEGEHLHDSITGANAFSTQHTIQRL
jgi:tetratricopeptide (TPR) repeat protein